MTSRDISMEDQPYYIFKIYILGKKGVGKFTFIKSCRQIFEGDNGSTTGVYYGTYDYFFNPTDKTKFALFQLWVQNLEDRFKFLMSSFITGSNAIWIMFDVSDHSSLDKIDDWMSVIRNNPRCRNIPIMLLGNKADLSEHLASSKHLANSLVKKYSLAGYYEISAFETI